MDALLILKALILGVVEGLTEFLPISSTGHLIIVGDLLKFTGERAKTFEIFIQLGSILGLMWFYRAKIRQLAAGLAKPPAQRFALIIFIAFLPAAVTGLLLHQYIREYLFNPITVAIALIAGGVIILIIERLPLRLGQASKAERGYALASKAPARPVKAAQLVRVVNGCQ